LTRPRGAASIGAVIADLHSHFPMHLVEHEEAHPRPPAEEWWEQLPRDLRAIGFDLAARLFDHPGADWRLSFDGLRAGHAGIVCSVLYWPFSEFEAGAFAGDPPTPGSFAALVDQLDDVERALERADPERRHHVVVRSEADLSDPRMRFVHCVEGGFHLGPEIGELHDQIGELAGRGVFYITLAHLFYRGVAANAPAIPALTDEEYRDIFFQPDEGLSDIGRAAIEAMVEHKVVVDVSHMRPDAIDAALDELDALDPGRTLPVIASHVGAADAGPPDHAYNLPGPTMRRIADRGGVIGVIAAQHHLGDTPDQDASREVLGRHLDAIAGAVGDDDHTGLGTDLDGFISPVLAGLDSAKDLRRLERWVRDLRPGAADAILHGNAERALRATFALR
jgi:microsomal dipeptidase-like Zn-dependent dipeptidase